ncbi:MAG: tetratricopeptide repeat protein [Desulfovibrionaceae bacterium]|nr:tetratricopeptide repeat protein [Desulfovibrionaceae bacterium]
MPKANFLGVFSTPGVRAEPGSHAKGEHPKQLWFVWQDRLSKAYLAQPINVACIPVGKPRLVPGDTFRQAFTHEPDIRAVPPDNPDVADYSDQVIVRGSRESGQSTLVGGRPARRGGDGAGSGPDTASAAPAAASEPAPAAAPEELDRSLRAEFAMNIMRLRRGDKADAVREFQRMVDRSDGIVPAHKHMFTDFGVDLRKSRLNDLALTSFQRALELSPNDSHALFNVGRALYELGQYQEAGQYLDKALALEPNLDCAKRLKEKIRSGVQSYSL